MDIESLLRDAKSATLIVLGLMIASLAYIVNYGIDKGFGLVMVLVFSATIAFAMLFFDDLVKKE